MLLGIGKETARNLLKHFETITNIINASEEELAELIARNWDKDS